MTLVVSIALLIFGIISKTTHILIITMFLLYCILSLTLFIINLLLSKKYYNDLVKHVEYIKSIEHIRYKEYFSYRGKELEDRIKKYNEILISAYKLSNIYINFLKDNRKFLSKDQYNNVLEIAKKDFRE